MSPLAPTLGHRVLSAEGREDKQSLFLAAHPVVDESLGTNLTDEEVMAVHTQKG